MDLMVEVGVVVLAQIYLPMVVTGTHQLLHQVKGTMEVVALEGEATREVGVVVLVVQGQVVQAKLVEMVE